MSSTVLAGLFTAVALVTTGEAMQVAGIEADRGCRDALRRSPGPTGAWPAAKAVASALTVLASTAPFFLGAAALCGVPRRAVAGRRPAAGDRRRRGGLLRRRHLVPSPRHRGVHRRARRTAPDGDVVEGVVTAVLMLPPTALLRLSGTVFGDALTPAVDAVLLTAVLSVAAVAARRLAGRDPAAVPNQAGRRHPSVRAERSGKSTLVEQSDRPRLGSTACPSQLLTHACGPWSISSGREP
ncbi:MULTISPECIES: hypothetical protein [Streptomyces]|uniref:hypothetical protein n=1 Tax=Streptomyces TaxID=1883 RepID=UPI00131DD2D4